MTPAERDAILEEAAVCAEQQNRVGREWVKDSLWDAIIQRVPEAIRRLKSAAPTAQQPSADRSPYIFGVKPALSVVAQQSLTGDTDALAMAKHLRGDAALYSRQKQRIDLAIADKLEALAASPAQSLTAGGAVPEWDLYGTGVLPWSRRIPANSKISAIEEAMQAELNDLRPIVKASRAVIPLPQVQIEALDTGMNPAFETDGNPCGYTWPTHKVIRRSVPDQQPVTPSGALAHNDGGVCMVRPPGWACSRAAGHDGPCATRDITDDDVAPAADDVEFLDQCDREGDQA
jgi:hypothetical protein